MKCKKFYLQTFISFVTKVFPDPGGPLSITTNLLGLLLRPGLLNKSSTSTVLTLTSGGGGAESVGGGGASGGGG